MQIHPRILLVAPPLLIFPPVTFLLPHLPVSTLHRFLGPLPPTATLLLFAILPFPVPRLLGPNVILGLRLDLAHPRLLPIARYMR